MSKLKISIVTVVKNGMPLLQEAIKSFDSQTYLDKEQIIVCLIYPSKGALL